MNDALKQKDLKPCFFCKQGVMHAGNICFTVVSIDRHLINVGAVRRQHGLEMMVGPLAQHMSPDEDITKVIEGTHPKQIFVCESCAMKNGLWEFTEAVGRAAAAQEES